MSGQSRYSRRKNIKKIMKRKVDYGVKSMEKYMFAKSLQAILKGIQTMQMSHILQVSLFVETSDARTKCIQYFFYGFPTKESTLSCFSITFSTCN